MWKIIILQIITFAAAILLVEGCQPQARVDHGEQFAPDDQTTAIERQLNAQADRGASADGTLYAFHFDGTNLNSLGAVKLDRMLRADGAGPLDIWMDLPDDDKAQSRRMAVAAYLRDHGLPPEDVTFCRGGNPDTDHPAAEGIKDLGKTDTSGAAGGGAAAAPGGSAVATPGAP